MLSMSREHSLPTTDRSLHVFRNLPPTVLADFSRISRQITLPKGAILFHENEIGDRIVAVRSGQVKLFCTSHTGRTLIQRIAMPGDLLGLSAVISGSPFEVTAEALMPVFADTIRRDDFLSFLSRHGEASMHTAKALSDAYKSAFFDARRFALSDSVTARVASILLDWGKASSDGDAEMHFTMALSREDFASFVGTTRETVTRVLVIFQKKKLIRIRGISLYILLPDELSQLCA